MKDYAHFNYRHYSLTTLSPASPARRAVTRLEVFFWAFLWFWVKPAQVQFLQKPNTQCEYTIILYRKGNFLKMNIESLNKAIELQQKASEGENSAEPSAVALVVYEALPKSIKPFFRHPRGVKSDDGEFIGSIIQVAKGSLGRLHGPALELTGAAILNVIQSLDERTAKQQEDNPLVFKYGGQEHKWDVRRYSSSQNSRGQWQSIPDYSLYIGCTFAEMREVLRTEEPEEIEEKPTATTKRRR